MDRAPGAISVVVAVTISIDRVVSTEAGGYDVSLRLVSVVWIPDLRTYEILPVSVVVRIDRGPGAISVVVAVTISIDRLVSIETGG